MADSIANQKERLILENPNLSSSALARFLGLNIKTVIKKRGIKPWTYRGYGIPFTTTNVNNDGVFLKLRFKDRTICSGKLDSVLTNLDRLIYCLENNNGKLPPTTREFVYSGLGFIKDEVN